MFNPEPGVSAVREGLDLENSSRFRSVRPNYNSGTKVYMYIYIYIYKAMPSIDSRSKDGCWGRSKRGRRKRCNGQFTEGNATVPIKPCKGLVAGHFPLALRASSRRNSCVTLVQLLRLFPRPPFVPTPTPLLSSIAVLGMFWPPYRSLLGP